MRVIGIDGLLTPRGWVTVTLEDDALHGIRLARRLTDVMDENEDAAAYAVNLPLADDARRAERVRACDAAARAFLARNADQVVPAPPDALLEAPDLDAARRRAEENGWPAPDPALWRARERVFEVRRLGRADERFVEAHPELSFTVLLRTLQGADAHLAHTRIRSVAAQHERLALLHAVGLRPARSMGGIGRASPEDVLAATVLAWTARRVATGEALLFPDDAPRGAPRLRA